MTIISIFILLRQLPEGLVPVRATRNVKPILQDLNTAH